MPPSSACSWRHRCFHLDLKPRQAASRCCEGAEEVLSFVVKLRCEDPQTHAIFIFPHRETGAKPVVHPQLRVGSSIWAEVGEGGPLAGVLWRWCWVPNACDFLVSTLQPFLVSRRAFHGQGGSHRHVWRSSPVFMVQAAITMCNNHFTLGCLHPFLLAWESCHWTAKGYDGLRPRLEKGVLTTLFICSMFFPSTFLSPPCLLRSDPHPLSLSTMLILTGLDGQSCS